MKTSSILFWVSVIIGAKFGYGYFSNPNSSELDAGMRYIAEGVNKSAPKMVDPGTRLDSAIGSSENFIYNYTLVNYSYGQIKPDDIQQKLRNKLKRSVCRSKTMAPMRELGVPITYVYHSNDGKQITSITIKTTECRS